MQKKTPMLEFLGLGPVDEQKKLAVWGIQISLVFAVMACGLLIDCDREAKAQTGWDLPELAQATAAYKRDDCRGAWDIIWPLAKAGNNEARHFLFMAVATGMMAPGDPGLSMATTARHNLTLAAYAALAPSPKPSKGDRNHKWARDVVPNAILHLNLGSKGERVAQCYKSGPTFRDCLDLAVSLGVVQKFEDYARDVETAAQETGLGARCLPR